MKNKYFLVLLVIFCFTAISFGQTTLKFQDFEGGTDDWTYTISPTTYNVSDNVWAIVTTVKAPVNTPQNGSNFWGIRDLNNDNGGSSSKHTLTFDNVNISNRTGVEISFYYITHGFDKPDYLKIEIFYDDVSQGTEELGKNTDAWILYAKSIPDAVNNVRITVIAKQNGVLDYAGLDNFRVRDGIAATCGFNFGAATATCKSFTGNTDSSDTYNVSIPYTGGGDTALIVSTSSGTVEGDNPSSSATGTIKITGITEGTNIIVTVAGGGLCDKTIEINSPNNCVAPKTFPIYEPFNQAVDTDLISDPYWINSSTSTDEIKLVSGTLSNPYNTGQFAESTGNMVSFAGSGSDSYIIFPETSSGTIYASFIFTVTDISPVTNSAGGYFVVLKGSSNRFPVKLWVKKNGTDDSKYDIGVSSGSSASNYHTAAHTPGEEVFIVLAYNFTANQIMVWINPDSTSFGSGGTIPTATLTESGASPANLGRFLLRQDINTKTPPINFDELRISTSWADVTPRGIPASTTGTTAIRDPNFEQVLIDLDYDSGEIDGLVLTANISGVTSLNVFNKGINSLSGIEAFTSLTSLACGYNQLMSLDVSKNTALTELGCGYNQLTSLDVSANTALTSLGFSGNQLTSLDISANTALIWLLGNHNQLTSLDVSKNTSLTKLYCDNNQLTSLDVSENTALTSLVCANNQLSELNVSENTTLTRLFCADNQLSELNVSKNTALIYLVCYRNRLMSLDVIANTVLMNLFCFNNRLTSLNVTSNMALAILRVDSNQLTTLDVSSNTALTNLSCGYNQLTSLNVANGNNDNFTLYYGYNPVANSFRATGNPDLKCIQVDNVGYSVANWPNKDETAFFSESCDTTNISDPNFEQALIDLGIDTNGKNGNILNSDAKGIKSLDVRLKEITSLTGIEAFTSLNYLNCRSNQLKILDVSANTNLISLNANMNNLESLDLSNNHRLAQLRCKENQLTSLNVANGNNSNFIFFKSINNLNLTCIQVDDIGDSRNKWHKDALAIYSENCSSTTSIAKSKQEKTILYFDENKDSELTGFSISPNPTNGILNITVDEKAEYRLLNIRGQTLKTGVLDVGESKISLSSFAKGIYLLNIETSKGSFIEKVVRN